jgi:hypothetical protein
MQPRPPALETAAARGPPEVLAMPARRMGCWMLRRVVRGVVIGPVDAIVAKS